ncbi:MAG TPA: hypothetical protein PLZ08_09540 [Bacillota bacterium]|jgi:hypothetical protein|nr:hypothetical protein [Bacillota bacterium]HOL09724.1 hypothetical protein [Bacillota bacterium]HPO98181.1 hypothetical protein [Bacillota bacterium]
MDNVIKPNPKTLDKALGEYLKNHGVVNIHCERCNEQIEVTRKTDTVFIVNCKCGLYNGTCRGL